MLRGRLICKTNQTLLRFALIFTINTSLIVHLALSNLITAGDISVDLVFSFDGLTRWQVF